MKNGFVKSSPRFFRLINRAILLLTTALLLLAPLIPAPLQEAADPARTPNPVKSAWFLLWIQELLSWSRLMIWPVLALALLFLLLPWLPNKRHLYKGSWFPREQWGINLLTVTVALAIAGLTIVALFFRGPNWSFSVHF